MKKQSVTLSNDQLLLCVNALSTLLSANPKRGIMLGFALEQNLKTMSAEATDVWAERDRIISQHAKRGEDGELVIEKQTRQDENGNDIVISQRYIFETTEAVAVAQSEMDELNAMETEVNLYRLPLDAFLPFGEQENISWLALEPIIDMES